MLLFTLCSGGILLLQPLTVSCRRLICPETALTSKNHGGIMVPPSLLRQLSRDIQYMNTQEMRERLGRQADRKMRREAEWRSWLRGKYKGEGRTRARKHFLLSEPKHAFSVLFLFGLCRLQRDACSLFWRVNCANNSRNTAVMNSNSLEFTCKSFKMKKDVT